MAQETKKEYSAYGGQAVIEGIVMKSPQGKSALVCRRSDGELVYEISEAKPLQSRYKALSWPIIRGVVAFLDALIGGMQILSKSAEIYASGEEEELEDWQMALAVAFSLLLGTALFMVLPTLILRFLPLFKIEHPLVRNLSEGLIRIIFFVIYLYAVSRLEDIKRVFQYHGAEHKTIHCYENKEPLTVANVKKHSTLHPRCGTSFLFIVMIVSSLFFSLFGWPNLLLRVFYRLSLMPLVAGVSYEVLRLMGKLAGESKFLDILIKPGLLMQKLTTAEPDELQIEVAIEALKAVLPPEEVV